MLVDILIIVLFIILNGIFTCAELAILSTNKAKIRQKAEEGNKKAILIKEVLTQTDTFLPSIAIAYTVMGIFIGTYSGLVFSAPISNWILSVGDLYYTLNEATLESIVVIVITVILSYVTIVFAETIPKKMALIYSEKIAFALIHPIVIFTKIIAPLAFILSKSGYFVLKILGIKNDKETEYATEEDIRMLVDEGEEVGNIDEDEREMIRNVFAFDDKTAEEIATHRTDIVSLDIEDEQQEILNVINENHSRIPVYEDNIDNIIGVLHIKDLIRQIIEYPNKNIDIKPLLRDPYFVPSSKKLNQLFSEMKKNKIPFSIIIDEYGGTSGIVTMEDLIEEVMGSIFDEYDDEESPEIDKIDDDTYIISGTASLEHVNETLLLELPTEEYDTLGGFVIGQIGRIPTNEEELEVVYEGVIFKVQGVYEKRIKQLFVNKLSNKN